ncbi:MAG: PRC-barrel domain-containing protein [Hadesarchaea archaeon]|nr:PRC-barrel domain-containing protein [Hadesarchaea archaeon]
MKVSEYYDMPIYSDKANYIGEVQDVVIDIDSGKILGLGFGSRGGKVTTVPYESVLALGDIILVESKRTMERTTVEEEPES